MACGQTITFLFRVGDVAKIGHISRMIKKRYRNPCGENIYIFTDKTWARECDIDNPTRNDVFCAKFHLQQIVCNQNKMTEKLFLTFNMITTKGVIIYIDQFNGLWTEDELVVC